jgi:hypothetical protein
MESYSAFEFLPLYFEFKAMIPDISQWNEKSLKDNPPRYYRFLQLKSLLKAFGLQIELTEFESGNFISCKDISEYKFVLNELCKFNKSDKSGFKSENPNEINIPEIEQIYTRFLQLLESVFIVKSFNSGLIEASSVSARFTYKTSKLFIEELYNLKRLMKIEQIIADIIDPERKKFSIAELKVQYNFPNVDLLDIDIDWM